MLLVVSILQACHHSWFFSLSLDQFGQFLLWCCNCKNLLFNVSVQYSCVRNFDILDIAIMGRKSYVVHMFTFNFFFQFYNNYLLFRIKLYLYLSFTEYSVIYFAKYPNLLFWISGKMQVFEESHMWHTINIR